ETARQLSANMQVVEESTRALRYLTALDMVARDSAKLKMQDPAVPREELEASRKQWLESTFANVPQGEEARLAAYMVRRGYMPDTGAEDLLKPKAAKGTGGIVAEADERSVHYSKERPEDTAKNWSQAATQKVIAAMDQIKLEIISSPQYRTVTRGGDRTQLDVFRILANEDGMLARLQEKARYQKTGKFTPPPLRLHWTR
ncbi:MAG: hypothetical protein HC888_05630, partial [Candidatus Competibacteraceae bacterium]|nr:hypothetical protein [Candidatus Competibacteraceae bacterium]